MTSSPASAAIPDPRATTIPADAPSTPAGATHRLKYMDVTQVLAIIAIHEPGDSDARDEETR